jgi:hypothetical protein
MTIDEAAKIVNDRYGFLKSYVTAMGKMLYVVAAEQELRAIPGVRMPEGGIAIFAPAVIELAHGSITIEGLVRRKNPELFQKSDPV